nr:thiamine pyrophosphate-dependent dehydrogenase E1 component subunit alpha [Rhodoferax sp.]
MIEQVFSTQDGVPSPEGSRQLFYRRMLAIRLVEQQLLDLVSQGKVRGTVHTCLGQEGCAVGVVAALDNGKDVICSNHRGHGHYLAYSGDVRGLIAEVLGLPTGVCSGIGGSQHLHRSNYYSNGILGGMPPVAVGMAAAERRLESGAVVCVFLGDGAMAEGTLYEALNLAGLWKLPILFAVEHNGYAQSTPSSQQHAGDLEARASAFGVPVSVVDGNDVEHVFAQAKAMVQRIRAGSGAELLFMRTYRLGPHSKGDDLRSEDELLRHRSKEPLFRLMPVLGESWCEQQELILRNEVAKIVSDLLIESQYG